MFGQEAAQGRIVTEIQGLVGREGAEAIQTMLQNSRQESEGIIATVVGFVTLIVGATGTFIELQDSLNTIWGVQPKPGRGIMGMLRDRLLSFAMVVGVGFLMLVLLVMSAGLAAVSDYIGRYLPDDTSVLVLEIVNIVVSLITITFVFAMIFKILPDVRIRWADVVTGAFITSLLFTLGKFLIGLYLGQSSFASTYGAAGSLAILFVWVYYSSLILFFGAEFTQTYANRYGARVVPSKNAVYVGSEICAVDDPLPHMPMKEKKDLVETDEKKGSQADSGRSGPERKGDNRTAPPPDETTSRSEEGTNGKRKEDRVKLPAPSESARTRSLPRI